MKQHNRGFCRILLLGYLRVRPVSNPKIFDLDEIFGGQKIVFSKEEVYWWFPKNKTIFLFQQQKS
jgi:hypothetical protein